MAAKDVKTVKTAGTKPSPPLADRSQGWRGSPLFLGLTLLVSGAYILRIALHGLPISEGWYSVYGRSINQGNLPYRDFDLLFTPMFTYIIAFLTRVLGYDIYALRIVGVALFLVLTVVIFFIYRRLFTPFISMVATITTVMFLQSEIVFIAYDYARWYDLFTLAALLTLLNFWFTLRAGSKRAALVNIALSGVFSGLAILTRQNSGLIYFVFAVLALGCILLLVDDRKPVYQAGGIYAALAIVPIVAQVLQLYLSGSLSAFLGSTTSGAIAAKGGMQAILFGWIVRSIPLVLMNRWEVIALATLMFVGFILYRDVAPGTVGAEARADRSALLLGGLYAAAAASGIFLLLQTLRVSAYFKDTFDNGNTPYVIYTVVLLMFVVSLVLLVRNRLGAVEIDPTWLIGLVLLEGAVLAIGFGSGTSAGLSQGETCLAMGLIIGVLLTLFEGKYRHVLTILVLAGSLMSVYTYVSLKNVVPYSWWGLTEAPIKQLDYSVDVPYLRHIRVSARAKDMYESAHRTLNENLSPSDRLFAFPHIPIFYLIQDKMPFTRSYVQWFDVVSDATIASDIQRIKQTHPKAIVVAEMPEFVMESHEKLFRKGRPSGLRKMLDFLKVYTQQAGYQVLGRYPVDNGYTVSVFVRAAFATGDSVAYVPLGKRGRNSVSQILQFDEGARLTKLWVKTGTFRLKSHVPMRARLVDLETGSAVIDTVVDSEELKNARYSTVTFPATDVKAGRAYRLDLSVEGASKSNAFLVYRTDPKTARRGVFAVVDGKKTNYNLCVSFGE